MRPRRPGGPPPPEFAALVLAGDLEQDVAGEAGEGRLVAGVELRRHAGVMAAKQATVRAAP